MNALSMVHTIKNNSHMTTMARLFCWALTLTAIAFVLLAPAPHAEAVDTTPPVITLNGINPATIFVGSTYTDAGATAVDNVDGTVAGTVNTKGVNANAVGTYTVNFSATDAASNTGTATRTVNVVKSPVWAENFHQPGDFAGQVFAIAETSDAIYYGGTFGSVGTVVANNIVRVDKATGAVTPLGSATRNGTNLSVLSLAVLGTDLYVGGTFTTVSDSTQLNASANRVAKWSTTSSVWTPLGSAAQNGTDSTVTALAVLGTDLYVRGSFSSVSSSTQGSALARQIAKWSTTSSTWTPLGSATQKPHGAQCACHDADGQH
jgi:hypothetical protein